MSTATKTANPARNPGPLNRLGTKVHNLVFTRDSGNDYAEFRVQCEIRIPEGDPTLSPEKRKKARDDADRVAVLLRDVINPTSLDELEQIVTPYIRGDATATFKATVHNAFLDHR